MSFKYLGSNGDVAYYSNDTNYVAVNTLFNAVAEQGLLTESLIAEKSIVEDGHRFTSETSTLAFSALQLLSENQSSLLASARLYTIPTGVKAEAKKALEWRKEHKRGGTPVGLNTARTLSKGGQIGIEKVRHIAKYFARHEVDKKGKGYKPGDDQFPSNGRIAWALWGGDAAWRWAKAIVERENVNALKADAGYSENLHADISPFEDVHSLDESIAPDFLARVRLDGSGIDRIYKIDFDGKVYVWDDGTWDDLGEIENGDVWTYDKSLDDPYDNCEKSHIQIDPESAIIICARLNVNPHKNISIEDIDEDEAMLAADAVAEEDWNFIDDVITAAGEGGGAVNDGYTPQERAQNASKQVRDGGGRFATQGKNVDVKGQGSGIITNVDQGSGNVTVKMDNGQSVVVSAKDTKQVEEADLASPIGPYNADDLQGPLDTSGILGEPRTPQNMPKAQLPGTYPPINREDLHKMLADFPSWVRGQRAKFSGTPQRPSSDFANEDLEKKIEEQPENPSGKKMGRPPKPKVDQDSYHPLLRLWERSLSPESQVVDNGNPDDNWAKPITAAGKPKGSDVQPVYLAIVAPDDPRAVIECVAIVPASATSNQPMTYVRKAKKWERDPKFLQDLQSATPPPVVPLKPEVLNDVLTQIDSLTASGFFSTDLQLMVLFGPRVEVMEEFSNLETLYAAGGLDRNRGNAEKLRHYWTRGEGAAKIRWGTPGDWTRCVRHLSKFMGVRAKGYCQLRHKDALGYYTSTHAKHDREHSVEEFLMEEVISTGQYGKPTDVTDKDMLMPLDEILNQPADEIYDGEWEPHPEIVDACKELAKCNDEEFEALTAAGGLDRNRGKAEKLRRYWTTGRGGRRKIKWKTGGDWTRCVRYLSKYLGPRAKGYCALRHKEVTGMWTGDKEHMQRYGGRRDKGKNFFSNEVINSTERVLELTQLNAKRTDLSNKIALIASSNPSVGTTVTAPMPEAPGSRFSIPLVIPELVESGDGRSFKEGAVSWRELPIPLMWQQKTGDGHSGSVVVGRIDHMERINGGIGKCHGVFDTSPVAREVERLIRNGFIRGTSADMDQFEATEEKPELDNAELEKPSIDKKEVGKDKLVIKKARIMAVTIVPKPAFQECSITLETEYNNNNPQQEEPVINDGIYVDNADEFDAVSLIACGMVAGAIPVNPPSIWFEKPMLNGPTPLTVTDEGQVYGHIASWDTDHIGLSRGTKPPRSRSNYAYFHTGVCKSAEGRDIPVGQLTLAGGHASLEASAAEAVRHYDDTASAVADVHAGEDAYGIFVAGALRPGTSPEQIRSLRASAPSGDWRPIRGSLELVAVCQVNVPGFPIARARVASGAVMALVAAGAATLAKMKSDPVTELNARIKKLEAYSVADKLDKVEEIKAKFAEFKTAKEVNLVVKAQELSERFQSLTAGAQEEEDVFAYIPMIERQKLAKSGKALPGGSFPIRNTEDLQNAIRAFGRAKESDRADVKRHIIKRARALGKYDLVPENWKKFSSKAVTASAEKLKAKLASAEERLGKAQATEFAEVPAMPGTTEIPSGVSSVPQQIAYDPASPVAPSQPEAPTQAPSNDVESGLKNPDTGNYTPQTQPRDENGKFRQVLARLKQDLGTAGLQRVLDEAKSVDKLHSLGSYVEAANASVNLQDIIGRLDSGALNNKALENVRNSAKELGTVIANLPLGFNNQAEKVRYSDLPPALRDLMDNMVEKVEAKIGKEDADIATEKLKQFKSGSDVFNQSNISSEMSRLLRLLT